MVDCFAKWKIVVAIKSDTNNVLVTVVRVCVLENNWEKKREEDISSNAFVKIRHRRSACLAAADTIFFFKSFHFGSYHHIKRLACAYKYVLYCNWIIELVCFRFLYYVFFLLLLQFICLPLLLYYCNRIKCMSWIYYLNIKSELKRLDHERDREKEWTNAWSIY